METANVVSESQRNAACIKRIEELSGVNLRDCYQCGKCAAGCPVASHANLTCRQVIRNLQLGLIEPVLNSDMPWACLGCAVCVARCPQNVNLPALMVAIKRVAEEQGIALRDVAVFDDAFMRTVKLTGISDETVLAGSYNVLSGHLFQDVANVPAMVKQGLIEVALPRTINNTAEMKELFERCEAANSEELNGTPSANVGEVQ